MPRKRKSRAVLDLWIDGVATATTLSVRIPQIVAGTMTPREAHRMVAEKILAVQEGWLRATGVAARSALRRRRAPPKPVSDEVAAIVEAAIQPARKTVRANAKRLGPPRPRSR